MLGKFSSVRHIT